MIDYEMVAEEFSAETARLLQLRATVGCFVCERRIGDSGRDGTLLRIVGIDESNPDKEGLMAVCNECGRSAAEYIIRNRIPQ